MRIHEPRCIQLHPSRCVMARARDSEGYVPLSFHQVTASHDASEAIPVGMVDLRERTRDEQPLGQEQVGLLPEERPPSSLWMAPREQGPQRRAVIASPTRPQARVPQEVLDRILVPVVLIRDAPGRADDHPAVV